MNLFENLQSMNKVEEATELRVISGPDTWAWQGANNFTDGSKPMIADGTEATIIVSGPDTSDESGAIVAIYYGEEGTNWGFKHYETKEDAITAAKELLPLIDTQINDDDLVDKGFTLV